MEMNPRVIPFRKLRVAILDRGYYAKDIANAIHISEAAMSARLNGKTPWTLREIYEVCDALNIRYEDIPQFFPKKDATV